MNVFNYISLRQVIICTKFKKKVSQNKQHINFLKLIKGYLTMYSYFTYFMKLFFLKLCTDNNLTRAKVAKNIHFS